MKSKVFEGVKEGRYTRRYEWAEDKLPLRKVAYRLAWVAFKARKKKRLSQQEVANATGIPQTVISYIESGWCNPSIFILIKLAKFYEIQVSDFFPEAPVDD